MNNTESSPAMSNYIIQHFSHGHLILPAELEEVCKMFRDLAVELDKLLDESPEKTVTLRKLLESMDAAIRSRDMDIMNKVRDERIAEVKEHLYPHGSAAPYSLQENLDG